MSTDTDTRGWLIVQIIAMCKYYGTQLDDAVVQMYADDLADLPQDKLALVLTDIRRDPKVTRFPLPAQVRARIVAPPPPAPTHEMIALDIAKKMMGALQKHGWNWPDGCLYDGRVAFDGAGTRFPTWKEAVEAELGPVAYEIIKRWGGWGIMYDSWAEAVDGIFTAQLRDHCAAVMSLSSAGRLEERPVLPGSPERRVTHLPEPETPTPTQNKPDGPLKASVADFMERLKKGKSNEPV